MVATTKVVGWGEAVQCLEQFYNLTAAYSLLVKGAAQMLQQGKLAERGVGKGAGSGWELQGVRKKW